MGASMTYNHDPNAEENNAGTTDDTAAGAADSTATDSEQAGGELLAGEFKTQEDLIAAYQALKDGKATEGDTSENTDSDETDSDTTETDQANDALESKGLSMGDFESEYAQNGELSAESYQKLEEAGIPKTMVDAYIDAMSVKADTMQKEVFDSVGGEESYMAMAQWASTNLTDAERTAFNKVVEGTDFEATKIAIAGLYQKYGKAVGTEGNMLRGTPPSNVGDVFTSNAEVVKAMSDPQYKKDAGYRAKVQAKLSRSNVLN